VLLSEPATCRCCSPDACWAAALLRVLYTMVLLQCCAAGFNDQFLSLLSAALSAPANLLPAQQARNQRCYRRALPAATAALVACTWPAQHSMRKRCVVHGHSSELDPLAAFGGLRRCQVTYLNPLRVIQCPVYHDIDLVGICFVCVAGELLPNVMPVISALPTFRQRACSP
jgi:hypothetical protein